MVESIVEGRAGVRAKVKGLASNECEGWNERVDCREARRGRVWVVKATLR